MHKLCSIAFVVGIAAVMGGCGSVNSGGAGSASLTSLDASGAVMGQQGRVRIFFSNPVGSATEVKLTSSDTSIATIPASVTVPAGAVSADVQFQGVAPGEVVFAAAAGTDSQIVATNVVDMLRVSPPSSATLEVGGKGIIGVGVNIRVPDPVMVSLASSQTSVATIDGTVTIPQFSSNSIAQVTAVAAGASIITASLNGQQATQTVTVVDKASITSMYGTTMLEAGGHGYVSLSLNAQLAQASTLMITSSDASVVSTPASYTMAAGSTYAYVDMTAVSAGTTTLTFTINGSTNNLSVTVLSKAQLENVYINGTPSVGVASQLYVNMDVTAAAAHDIALVSSDPTVVTVPATTTVYAGTSGTSVSITPLKMGDSVVTATFNGISRQVDVHVGSSGYTLSLYGQNRLAVGTIGQLSIQTGVSTATTVNLSSSDPTVISVPASIVVANSETAPMNVLKAGTVTITATSGSASATFQITVVTSPGINYFGPTFNVGINGSTNGYLYLDTAPPLGTDVTFTTSDASVAPAPAPVTITSQGQTYIPVPIQGGAVSGTATLTATLGSTHAGAIIYVGGNTSTSGGNFQSIGLYYNVIEVGAATTVQVYFNPPPPSGDTGTIALSNPNILSTPNTTLSISGTSDYDYFPVTGLVAGASDVTVTASGVSQTTTVNVLSACTPSLYVPTPIKVGSTVTAQISTVGTVGGSTYNCLPAKNKTFSLTSNATGIANPISQSATIGPPNTYTTFGVKGVAAGSATVSVTIGTTTLTAPVTVQ